MTPALLALVLLAPPALADDGTLFTVQDPAITESSGLVEVGRGADARVLTINDSGDGPVVYVVDARSGRTTGRSSYAGDAVDVEAITPGPDGDVWVGDIGDNGAVRAGIRVHRLPALGDGDREVPSTAYDLAYRGGARDAETLLVHPQTGRLYVVSKGFMGGQVHAAPQQLSTDRPNELRPTGPAPGIVTDGAFFPDGRHVVLRDYSRAHVLDTTRTPWQRVGGFPLPEQPQGEGIAVRADGASVLVSTEGEGQPVQVVPLPSRLLAAMEPPEASASPPPVGDEGEEPGLGTIAEKGAVPWTLVGGVVGAVVLLGLAYRLRDARRRGRSRG